MMIKSLPSNTGSYVDMDTTNMTEQGIEAIRAIPFKTTKVIMTFPNTKRVQAEDFEITVTRVTKATKITEDLQYYNELLDDIRGTIVRSRAVYDRVDVPQCIKEAYINLNFHMMQMVLNHRKSDLSIITTYNEQPNTYFKLGGTKFYFKVSYEDNFRYHVKTPLGIFGLSDTKNQFPTLLV